MMNKQKRSLFISAAILVLIGGIFSHQENKNKEKIQEIESIVQVEEENINIKEKTEVFASAWMTYWDYNAGKRHLISMEKPLEVVAFAAIFKDEEVYVPNETHEMLAMLREAVSKDTDIYLSFVNDLYLGEDEYKQKSKELLERILKNEEKKQLHIQDLIETAKELEVTGIEIDYENIRDDKNLWVEYARFIKELYETTQKESLNLRVVLSYDAVKYTDFPEGPHYMIMCYNLYGTHSGPGPKTDIEFLEMCFTLNEVLKPNVSMAFSNNGFSWSSSGEVTAVTKTHALERAAWLNLEPQRDPKSGALHYQYIDSKELTHEVWFADDQTLECWMTLASQAGYKNHALWRYGD